MTIDVGMRNIDPHSQYLTTLQDLVSKSDLSMESTDYNDYISGTVTIGGKLWRENVQNRVGVNLCNTMIQKSLGDELDLESSIIRVLGFGYRISTEMARSFCGYDILKGGAIEASIFNLAVSFYDLLCDQLNRTKLVNDILNKSYLRSALDGKLIDSNCYILKDPYIRFFDRLTGSFFIQLNEISQRSPSSFFLDDYKYSISKTYFSYKELQEANVTENGNCLQLYFAWMKSCMPTWIMFEIVALSQRYNISKLDDFIALRRKVFALAEFVWVLDDLVDIFIDAQNKHFNIFLKYNNLTSEDLNDYDINKLAVVGIAELDLRLKEISKMCYPELSHDLVRMIRCVTNSWIS